MRIGIVGGGGAGLTSAWLLEEHHDVTLFERDRRLGGHAQTFEVEAHGQRFPVDAGFQFFGPGTAYATFNRLLDALEVPRRVYAATSTLYGGARTFVLPPVRRGAVAWRSLTPTSLRHLMHLRGFLADIPSFMQRHDTTITMGEYLERQRLPRVFVDEVAIPLLLSFWCVELDEFLGTAAYNTLFYLSAMQNGLRAPQQFEVEGGMKTYVDALAAALTLTDMRVGAGAMRLERTASGFVLYDSTGRREEFDAVVIAAPAHDALALVEPVRAFDRVAQQLRRFEFFDARIAIHGDRRLMPPRESEWSVVNARWDGVHSQLSIWNPERGLPVFRSWITYEDRMPDPLYAVVDYRHGRGTVAHFDAQRRLRMLQGEHGLWLAGMYTDDADSHESAIHSAVRVAQRLAPGSSRLALLEPSRPAAPHP